MVGTPSLQTISTKQLELAQRAERYPHEALSTLAHFIDLDWLREAYRRTRKDGAPGVDGQVAAQYEADLEANLSSLLDRFKSGRYRAPPVKRVYIPKGDGKRLRPIGMPTLEDKVLQRAVVMLLEPLYEQQFLDCSYGFRPGRSAHQALDELWFASPMSSTRAYAASKPRRHSPPMKPSSGRIACRSRSWSNSCARPFALSSASIDRLPSWPQRCLTMTCSVHYPAPDPTWRLDC
jgi:hypothetical protein